MQSGFVLLRLCFQQSRPLGLEGGHDDADAVPPGAPNSRGNTARFTPFEIASRHAVDDPAAIAVALRIFRCYQSSRLL
jgi:hypothetical protein